MWVNLNNSTDFCRYCNDQSIHRANRKLINNNFNNHFIIYQPKTLVPASQM